MIRKTRDSERVDFSHPPGRSQAVKLTTTWGVQNSIPKTLDFHHEIDHRTTALAGAQTVPQVLAGIDHKDGVLSSWKGQ